VIGERQGGDAFQPDPPARFQLRPALCQPARPGLRRQPGLAAIARGSGTAACWLHDRRAGHRLLLLAARRAGPFLGRRRRADAVQHSAASCRPAECIRSGCSESAPTAVPDAAAVPVATPAPRRQRGQLPDGAACPAALASAGPPAPGCRLCRALPAHDGRSAPYFIRYHAITAASAGILAARPRRRGDFSGPHRASLRG
jgi:hypothetical protein